MKREIKFRGLDKQGKWHYGFYAKDYIGDAYITAIDGTYAVIVIPESVGQYTGLKDKNGKEIYEGDIVNLYNVGYGFNTGRVIWGAHSIPSFTAEQVNEDFPSTYDLQVRPDQIEIIGISGSNKTPPI